MTTLFDLAELQEIVDLAKGKPQDEMFETVISELEKRYPGRITREFDWVFNNACGAMGTLKLLYGSLTEYVILFGTPIGTEGHSGRYPADVYDWMLDGEMWTYYEGETTRTVSLPGDRAHLARGRAKGYRVPDQAWMLEYSRGIIPLMLPMGTFDNIFSNLDFRSMFRLLWDYGKICIRELFRGKL